MLTDPAFLPWREQALARGYASSIALPLKADGVTFGALMIYCAEPDPFSDDEVRLLTDLADDLAHGIHVLRLQAAHARAEEGMRVAHEALAEADRRKDEFLAILSHELRNPLAAIRYAVPLLQQERLSATGARGLGVVDRQLDHLTRLVDDLLDISRITSGKIELRREQVTLDAIVKAATEASSPAIAAARHALKILLPDEPIWLHGDSARLAQILTNILSNATRYTPCGGEITLEARRDEGQAVIRVRDNGIGIPPEALTTIFDMFRQVDRPDSSQGGLGIGLALVRQLVEMHGGSIEAQSAGIGQGATFEIRLPISREGRAAGPDRTRLTPALSPRLRVLVVDDNTDLADMLAIVVENAGHEVRKALDGATAVAAALSFRPHVVLLDLGLPIMSGIEVAKELRRHPEMSGVRLVALTGWGQADDRSQTREAGFDDHLTKPTDPVELERLLADAGNALANP